MTGKTTPAGIYRREIFIDARDLQSSSEDEQLTAEQYTQLLQTRGTEKLAENQLVKSFSTQVRTYNPTYEYGESFFLGDTITVTDERLGITADAVVHGVEHSISRDGENLILTLGYSLPSLSRKLKRKAEK